MNLHKYQLYLWEQHSNSFKISLAITRIGINTFLKKYFKEFANIYYDKCFLWRNLCWVWKKKQQNIGFPTL